MLRCLSHRRECTVGQAAYKGGTSKTSCTKTLVKDDRRRSRASSRCSTLLPATHDKPIHAMVVHVHALVITTGWPALANIRQIHENPEDGIPTRYGFQRVHQNLGNAVPTSASSAIFSSALEISRSMNPNPTHLKIVSSRSASSFAFSLPSLENSSPISERSS